MKRKKFKKRTLLCVIMALVIVMGSTSVVYAEVFFSDIAVVRKSNTLAIASADVEFFQKVEVASIKMVLQEKYNNTWKTAIGMPIYEIITYGYNTDDLYLAVDFTLEKGKVYRIIATFSDKTGSTSFSDELISSTF